MMLRSEHGRHKGDDRIITNGGRQDVLDEHTEASHKAPYGGSLRQQVNEKNNERWWRRSTDEIDRKVNRAVIVGFGRSRCRTYIFFKHSECKGGCRSRWLKCLMQVRYSSVKGIDRDHSQSYDRLAVTRWDYCRHWWIYQIWRSQIAWK